MSFNGLGSGTNPVVTSVKINGVAGTNPTGVAVVTGRAIDYSFSNASADLNGMSWTPKMRQLAKVGPCP